VRVCKKYIQEINSLLDPIIEKYKKQAEVPVKKIVKIKQK